MRIVGYCRCSTEQQSEFGFSLPIQIEKVRGAANSLGVELDEIIVDSGKSARNLKRPGMERLLHMIEQGQIQTIIVASLSRLTRSVSDLAVLLGLFHKHHVSLMSVQESLDTNSASGRLLINLLCVVSQWEREILSERTKDAMLQKKLNGERIGTVPFGFQITKDGKHLTSNLAEQRVIQRVHQLRKEGHTLRSISDHLNRANLTTRRGGTWNHVYVARLLRSNAA